MSCDRWRESISAVVDGEESPVDIRLLDAHLFRCAECRTYRDVAEQARRAARLHAVRPAGDMPRRVARSTAIADRASRWSVLRIVLAVVALEIIALSLPDLLVSSRDDSARHAARHLGAFTVAYGAALLVVVARPARARAMLPVSAVLAGALAITAVVDVASRRIPLLGETQHVPEMLSVLLIWLMTVPTRRRFGRSRGRSGFEHVDLHAVDDGRRTG